MSNAGPGEITLLLGRWEQGEPGAVESLAPLVYDQLRAIAEAFLRKERLDHTLQPTAVVNEVFLDLLRARRLAMNDRGHFFAFAAQLTRRVLIDSARKAKAKKRGLGWTRIPLDAELAWLSNESAESLDLSGALGELAEFDAAKTRAIELHYFLGCTLEETADILQVSKSTVERSLRFSLAWLHRRLHRK
ncbi:MAG TPA: ECF-type sigma factor [Bryobacteraceae bacterium]|nr:ECF-type sigma factor [Bryobacteraceae bacterium]